MKKLFAALVICFVVLGVNLYVNAADYGVYVEPKLAIDVMTSDYTESHGRNNAQLNNTTFGGGLAVGYDFFQRTSVPVRVELEYMLRSDANFDFNGENVRVATPQTLFANAYVDFQNQTIFTPYFGGGVGTSFLKSDMNFAWNVGAGCAIDLVDDWKATLGYRYVDFGHYDVSNTEGDLKAHEVQLGLRYTF